MAYAIHQFPSHRFVQAKWFADTLRIAARSQTAHRFREVAGQLYVEAQDLRWVQAQAARAVFLAARAANRK